MFKCRSLVLNVSQTSLTQIKPAGYSATDFGICGQAYFVPQYRWLILSITFVIDIAAYDFSTNYASGYRHDLR